MTTNVFAPPTIKRLAGIVETLNGSAPLLDVAEKLRRGKTDFERGGSSILSTKGRRNTEPAKGQLLAYLLFENDEIYCPTLENFLLAHLLVMAGKTRQAGVLRSAESIADAFGHVPCHADCIGGEFALLGLQVENMLARALSDQDLCVIAAFAHARMVFMQPCETGTGIAARILTWAHLNTLLGGKEKLRAWDFTVNNYDLAIAEAARSGNLGPLTGMIAALHKDQVGEMKEVIESPFSVLTGGFDAMQGNEGDVLCRSRLLCSFSRKTMAPNVQKVRRARQ